MDLRIFLPIFICFLSHGLWAYELICQKQNLHRGGGHEGLAKRPLTLSGVPDLPEEFHWMNEIISWHQRMQAWISRRGLRSSWEMMSASSAASSHVSITNPRVYGPGTIQRDFSRFKVQLPTAISRVLASTEPLPLRWPVRDTDMISYAHELRQIYEDVLRWQTLLPSLDYFKWNASRDLRGFYMLSQSPTRSQELANFQSLPQQRKNKLRWYLIQMCRNKKFYFSPCISEVDAAISRGRNLNGLYDLYLPAAQKVWSSMFAIDEEHRRKNLTWRDHVLEIPTLDEEANPLLHVAKGLIEGAWRDGVKSIQLRLLTSSQQDLLRFVLAPNVLAHASQLGGDQIVINSGANLKSSWTRANILHEFGHILGLPDCYVEFFDEMEQVMVTYGLDESNIMCSGSGRVHEVHWRALEEAY